MRAVMILCAAAVAAGVAGCAAITEGSSQSVAVVTVPAAGADCALSNSRGQWSVVTPGSATVLKSGSTMKIVCTAPGWQETTDYVASGTSAKAVVGSVLPYWNILEMIADSATGAGSVYPAAYTVRLKPLESAAPASIAQKP